MTETEQVGEQQNHSPSILRRIIDWLTAGYPTGIPAPDRFPVIAVLKRRLTDDDIREIVAELTADDSPALVDGAIGRDEVEELLARVLKEQPTDLEVRRVSSHLAAGGWPLAWSDSAEQEPGATTV
ncbi:MAG: DUF3349 domain-containing protein [Microlunatus sp.]|nr:DUF3349 domain-containing protein [Microlunatus sp.]